MTFILQCLALFVCISLFYAFAANQDMLYTRKTGKIRRFRIWHLFCNVLPCLFVFHSSMYLLQTRTYYIPEKWEKSGDSKYDIHFAIFDLVCLHFTVFTYSLKPGCVIYQTNRKNQEIPNMTFIWLCLTLVVCMSLFVYGHALFCWSNCIECEILCTAQLSQTWWYHNITECSAGECDGVTIFCNAQLSQGRWPHNILQCSAEPRLMAP